MATVDLSTSHTKVESEGPYRLQNRARLSLDDKSSANGHSTQADDILVTRRLSQFVHSFRAQDLNDDCVTKLKQYLLDYIGVGASAVTLAESSPAFFKAVKALVGDATGRATVLAKQTSFPPQHAALLNGAFAHSLDFDDTYADGRLHPGVSVISAALAQAEDDLNITTQDLLTALAVGYEVNCRLARALGPGAYEQGFHNTGTTGIFGATAAIAKLKRVSAEVVENAFGVALSKAAGSMQYLENGSWNKRLHPGFAAHDAFVAVAMAEAGVLGTGMPVEGKFGLLHAYSANPAHRDPRDIVKNLGISWRFIGTAIKPFPACRMTHGTIQAASELSKERSKVAPTQVKRLTVRLPSEGIPIVGARLPNKVHPNNVVDAQFSSYYQAGVAWLHGSAIGWRAYDFLQDPDIYTIAEKTVVESCDAFSKLESSLTVEWEDGVVQGRTIKHPLGEEEAPLSWDDVENKFLSLVVPVYGDDGSKHICEVVKNLEKYHLKDLMALVR